jgi:phage pi2 protein 07
MLCKICQKDAEASIKNKILNKFNIQYFYCKNCDFLFTEDPFWLEEAYSRPINNSDTGILQRNIANSFITTNLIFYIFNKNKTFLDYAGGYGIFTRIMRDIGINFKWQDNYTQNLLAKGFEYKNEKIELITAFEVFEHFVNPIEEIEKILKISKNILFSTELKKESIPENNWWYYGIDHGQHTSFYSKKTLKFIAKQYNLYFYTNNKNIHLISEKKINKLFFRILINKKTGLLFNLATKFFLKSKTWDDYLKMRS